MKLNVSKFKALTRKRREQGLTLIEASMVLALSAVVVAGVMLYYQSASDNNRLQSAEGELGAVQTAVQTIYAGQSTYAGLKTNMLEGNAAIPPNLQNGASIYTPWGASTSVSLDTADGGGVTAAYYTVTFSGVPKGDCISMGAQSLGAQLVGVAYQGGTTYAAPTPTAATAGCTTDSNEISWEFQ
jgi:major structural subunit of bundle-forming pilus